MCDAVTLVETGDSTRRQVVCTCLECDMASLIITNPLYYMHISY